MFALLKLIFVFFIAALLVALFFVVAFFTGVWSLFHKAKNLKSKKCSTNSNYSDTYTQYSTNYQRPTGGKPRNKIIPQDEGEYVDFEEVK